MSLEFHAEVCRSKSQYATRSKAMKIKKARAAQCKRVLSVYKCRLCGMYHLTSQARRPIEKRVLAEKVGKKAARLKRRK